MASLECRVGIGIHHAGSEIGGYHVQEVSPLSMAGVRPVEWSKLNQAALSDASFASEDQECGWGRRNSCESRRSLAS